MRSSPEEAIVFFRKWQEDRILLRVTLSAGEITVVADAAIAFSEDGLMLIALGATNNFSLEVPLVEIDSYDYFTVRDVGPEALSQTGDLLTGESWLLTTRNGIKIALFEQGNSN